MAIHRLRLERMDAAERLGVVLLASFFFVGSAVPLAISFAVSPEAIERGEVVLTPPCPTLAATGRECASCGLTRAFCAMSRGELAAAARFNAAGPALYAAFCLIALGAAALIAKVAALSRRARLPDLRSAPRIG